MFKKLLTFVMAIALIFAFTLPLHAASKDMWAYVYTWDGGYNADGTIKLTRQTSGITFKVLQAGSDTAETLTEYNDNTATSLTNPVTTTNYESATVCNDMVAFRVDPGESGDENVDLIVTDTDGMFSIFYEDFNQYVHTIVIDARPGVPHIGIIWFSETTTDEQDTGIDFRYDTFIKDCRVEIVETCSACTMNVGLLTDDPNGFRAAVLMTTAGFIADTGIITNHASADYTAVTTYGALLHTALTGTSAHSATASNAGGRTYMGHVVTGSASQSLTYNVASITSGEGYIYIEHVRLR